MSISKTLITGVAVGLFASWIKSLAEPPLQKLGEEKFPPEPEELRENGADVTRRPKNMPPAILANRLSSQFCGEELSHDKTLQYMSIIHYSLGSCLGIAYVALANKHRKLRVGEGAVAGAVIWTLTHGSTVPALGLQGKVSHMPKAWWVWEFGSHILFGIALEQTRKLINKSISYM